MSSADVGLLSDLFAGSFSPRELLDYTVDPSLPVELRATMKQSVIALVRESLDLGAPMISHEVVRDFIRSLEQEYHQRSMPVARRVLAFEMLAILYPLHLDLSARYAHGVFSWIRVPVDQLSRAFDPLWDLSPRHQIDFIPNLASLLADWRDDEDAAAPRRRAAASLFRQLVTRYERLLDQEAPAAYIIDHLTDTVCYELRPPLWKAALNRLESFPKRGEAALDGLSLSVFLSQAIEAGKRHLVPREMMPRLAKHLFSLIPWFGATDLTIAGRIVHSLPLSLESLYLSLRTAWDEPQIHPARHGPIIASWLDARAAVAGSDALRYKALAQSLRKYAQEATITRAA